MAPGGELGDSCRVSAAVMSRPPGRDVPAAALVLEVTVTEAMKTAATEMASTLDMHIDGVALLAKLQKLASIGALPGGGVCRLAFSQEDQQGRAQVVAWMRALGLAVRMDPIGNVVGRREGRESGLAAVMTGSHIDTVRTGGPYDGNLGVLAGLEVVAALNAAGITTRRPIEVAFFSNEEGCRFPPDMMGSLVYAGDLSLDEARASMGEGGLTAGDACLAIGQVGEAVLPGPQPHAFVELHIEQGPLLDAEGLDIGVVAAVQGISWQRFFFEGVSNHAGTCPMAMRHDAGFVAAQVVAEVRAMTSRYDGAMVATVGELELRPNLVNVVPNRVQMTVDLRNTNGAELARAERDLDAFVQRIADAEGVSWRSERMARFEPHTFTPRVAALISAHAADLGLQQRHMVSGAGHDAQIIGRRSDAAMIFVPSVKGISHNIAEHTEPHHLIAGADVLLRTMVSLAEEADEQDAAGAQL